MSNRWMIRTKDFSLKGPISAEAIISMLGIGQLGDEDEICQGNGYWFYLGEEMLVDEFLKRGKHQPFNPVNAVPSPVASESSSGSIQGTGSYKDENSNQKEDSTTQIINLASLNLDNNQAATLDSADSGAGEFVEKTPSAEDLEYPEEGDRLSSTSAVTEKPSSLQLEERRVFNRGGDRRQPKRGEDRRKSNRSVAVDRRQGDRRQKSRRKKSQSSKLLKLWIILLLVSLAALLYYYVQIQGQPLPFTSFVSTASAQIAEVPLKKKELI